jgi:4-hydroxy-tetrahydrodipicolinate synthase
MAHSMTNLHGIIPPVCTPFHDDYSIDHASLERLVNYLVDGGVHGLFALGSTSEMAYLTPNQRSEALEALVAFNKGRVPVLAGVIDMTTAQVVAHGLEARRLGADALVVTAPYYIRASQKEVIDHFREIHRAVGLPIMAYDIPVAVQAKLAPETLRTLASEGTIVGLKDSSGADALMRGLILDTQDTPSFRIFTGSELLVDGAFLMGAHGCVPGLGNVDPAGYARLYDLCMAGQWDQARREQERLYRLFRIIEACAIPGIGVGANAMGGFKTALMLLGVIATNQVGRPQTRYDQAGVDKVAQLLREDGLLK